MNDRTFTVAVHVDGVRWLAESDGYVAVARPDAETPATSIFDFSWFANCLAAPVVELPREEVFNFVADLLPTTCAECKGATCVPCVECDGTGKVERACDHCSERHDCVGGCGDCDGQGSVPCECIPPLTSIHPCEIGNLGGLWDRRRIAFALSRLPTNALLIGIARHDRLLILRAGRVIVVTTAIEPKYEPKYERHVRHLPLPEAVTL